MFLGLRTAIYRATDLDRSKSWYGDALGIEPYFDEPYYVGFNVGGFELGLLPEETEKTDGDSGVIVYWGVENIDSTVERLLALGAGVHTGIQDVGEGIRVASVLDPDGNVLGVIENPNFSL